jgi:hypothetical protein
MAGKRALAAGGAARAGQAEVCRGGERLGKMLLTGQRAVAFSDLFGCFASLFLPSAALELSAVLHRPLTC